MLLTNSFKNIEKNKCQLAGREAGLQREVKCIERFIKIFKPIIEQVVPERNTTRFVGYSGYMPDGRYDMHGRPSPASKKGTETSCQLGTN